LSPDGKYVVVTHIGKREYLTVLRADNGEYVSRVPVNANRNDGSGNKEGLYFGLAFGEVKDGKATLYASMGALDTVDVFSLDGGGVLSDTGKRLLNFTESKDVSYPHHVAGIALNSDGSRLYAVNNQTYASTNYRGSLSILNTETGTRIAKIDLPGFPFAVAAVTKGAFKDRKVYVTSERDGLVSVVDPQTLTVVKSVKTGAQTIGVVLNNAQTRLYVANAGSDTISVLDTATDRVIKTVLLRPDVARGLAGATPTGLSLSMDEARLFVTLGDMNAVAVVETQTGKIEGYLPTGWYPTSVTPTRDGKHLFVTNAKGVQSRNPNSKPVGDLGRYVLDIMEGATSLLEIPNATELARHSAQVLINNRLSSGLSKGSKLLTNPGIKHVIYIIKENRTYDQVFGDLPQGNGDPSLCLFPRSVTPNHHALAERFALLDNFYCCAEVSADGWNWSVSGMISAYNARNSVHNYSDRGRNYDFEGENNGVPVDLRGMTDVSRSPSGYIWDLCQKHGVSFRNYGFYLSFAGRLKAGVPDEERRVNEQKVDNMPTKRTLLKSYDPDFRRYDLTYADSELWKIYNCPAPNQMKSYGKHGSSSRFAEWKREFDAYCQNGNLPRFSMVRLCRDHTSGTATGAPSPRAMVADNDYALGQLVEAVSKSRYWKETAICVLEDDAQAGYDHVDAHRSPALVISPFVVRGTVDSRFYNTDSMLRTMELLLGLPPMCQYDAVASPIAVFGKTAANDGTYTALLPDRAAASEINTKTAYRAKDSLKLINPLKEESLPDLELSDILWHAIKGRNTPKPTLRYNFTPKTNGQAKRVDYDDDDDAPRPKTKQGRRR
jgi:YVTN family beta-propeller protein